MALNLKKAAVAGTLCALLLAAPTPAAAHTTVSVEFVYGGVAACGIGIFLYFGASWEIPFAARGLQGALLEVDEGRAHFGVPIPNLSLVSDPSGERVAHDAIQIDLFRWRF